MTPSRFPPLLLALSALPLSATTAGAISAEGLKRLPLTVERAGPSEGTVTLERLGAYLSALKRAGHSCRLSTYAYGGTVVCRTRAGTEVLIDVQAVPTRGPEFANVGALRPDGIDSTPLATSDVPTFLKGLKSRR